jgi:DNA polymerase III subunit gamma/tau
MPLLKTLEEPPKHAIFALCTTETHKVPETIVSRCTVVPFTKATAMEVENSLRKAVKGEALDIEPQALASLAERVDGSFRDGMKHLEQLAQLKRQILIADVNEVTGFGELYDVSSLLKSLWERDIPAGLAELQTKESAGVDMPLLGKRLVETLRKRFIALVTQPSYDADEAREWLRMASWLLKPCKRLKGRWCRRYRWKWRWWSGGLRKR